MQKRIEPSRIRNLQLQRFCLASRILYLGHNAFSLGFAGIVGQHNPHALTRQAKRHVFPKPSAAAGHQSNFPGRYGHSSRLKSCSR